MVGVVTGEHAVERGAGRYPARGWYDVVVIGGGAAGLSAALTLARARRRILVIDAGEPRNGPSGHVHGFISREGISPGELLEVSRSEVRSYGGEVIPGRAISAEPTPGGFRTELAGGGFACARRLLVTTGVTDELPDIPGLRQLWGRDVLHCPYCHGWEVRDRALGVLATGSNGVRQALLLRQWTDTVSLFLHTNRSPSGSDLERLAARDIRLVRGQVHELVVTDGRLVGVRLADRSVVPLDALFFTPRFIANDGVLTTLGAKIEHGPSRAWVVTDATGMTTVRRVWAAGNVTDPTAPAISAAGRGTRVAFAINDDLITEDVDQAVSERHRRLDAEIFATPGESSMHGMGADRTP